MAEENDVLLTFKVDTREVEAALKKKLSGTMNVDGGGGGGASGSKASSGGGGGGSSSVGKAMGGIGSMFSGVGGAAMTGIALGAIVAKFADQIVSRRQQFATATMTNMNQAQAGLINGAQFASQNMQASMQNLTSMWGGIPIISSMIQGNMQRSQEYQKFQTEAAKQQNIQGQIGGGMMGAYDRARSMGYKLSEGEQERLFKINEQLAAERQQVQEGVNKRLQSTSGAIKLNVLKDEFDKKQEGLNPLKEVLDEIWENAKQFFTTDFPSAMRSAIGM